TGRGRRARPPRRRARRAVVAAGVPGAGGVPVGMTTLGRGRAYAKINLCLFLGPLRSDGRHELVTVFDSVGLCDELTFAHADADRVLCDGVHGPNLVADALAALRVAGWEGA